MSYATLADLTARFGETEINQIADTDRTGTPDPALIQRALGDADSEIDAALRGRYRLPVRPTPPVIIRIACELAREALYVDAAPELVANRAKWARETLKGIARGELQLGNDVANHAPREVEIVTGRDHAPFAAPVVERRQRR
jgi:phage gp36-like protein